MSGQEVDIGSHRQLTFGIRLPAYASQDLMLEGGAKGLASYGREVEELGFDSVWVIDHLLVAPALYATSWPDPLEILSVVAGATESCLLGTAILVAPLWHPVLLAKRIATLASLAHGRFILGVGTGWEPAEFASLGLAREQRGRRTDEVLRAMKRLWTEEAVTFEGEFFSFRDVTIEPRLARRPDIWVAGGSVTRAAGEGDPPHLAKSVRDRIVEHEGWICRSGGTDFNAVVADWKEICEVCDSAARARPRFTHTQWVHIVESTNEEEVIAEQVAAFRRVMGDTRSVSDLRDSYLIGTVDQVLAQVERLRAIGVEYLMINPVLPDPKQLKLIAKYFLGAARV